MNIFQQEPETPNAEPDKLMEKFAGGMMKFDNKFLEQRRVFLWGGVHDESAEKIVNRLLFWKQPTRVRIFSFTSIVRVA